MKKAFVAILSLAALVACSQDVTLQRNDSAAISFDNFIEKKTRVATDPSTTTESLSEFSVWGFRGESSALVLQEERVYKTAEGWVYDNLQYWNEGADYFFAAVSPVKHSQVEVDATGLCKTGLGTITFTNTAAGDVDLIYASKLIDKSDVDASNPEKVKLQFAHLLAKVKFSIAYDFPNALTTVAVKDLKIANSPAVGTIDLTNERANWLWTLPQTGETVTLEFGDIEKGAQFPLVNEYYESDKECLLIPADATRSYTITFMVEVYNNGVLAGEYPKTVTLTDKAFVQGKNYNIKTVITPDNIVDGGLKPIEFEVIEVEPWVDGDADIDEPVQPEEPGDDNDEPEAFEPVASEWGVVGDLNNWGGSADVVMYTTETENLFVAKNVAIESGAFKVRANNAWNDAKNYGLEVAGQVYVDKYYAVITGSGSQNITPMEYGTYDVYFDLEAKRVALMTPGKAYTDAADGGKPVVIVSGLKDHEWGLVGSFNGWDVANYVTTVVEGDWAVAKNVTLENGAEFKFAADKAWSLSYGSACDVNVDVTYSTYNNGGNMKFVGEAGAYDVYFSLVTADFYMTAAVVEEPETPVEPVTPAAGSEVTVAKFLEMADTANEFVLTGEITRVVNETYGNFDLTDATGTIYIYGLLTPEGTAQQQWAAAGLRQGDTVTIKGVYNEYNGTAQVKNAIYVSHVAAPFVSAEPVAINADDTVATIVVKSNVAWTVSCDADWVTSYTTSGANNGEIAVVAAVNALASNRTATFTISGEGVADFTVTLTQYAAGAVDTKGTYTSEDFLKGGTSTSGKYYMEKVNVAGTQYDCLKLGTSSVVGDYTTKAVNEAGDLTLSFYAVGWNGKTSKLNVYVDGVKVGETLTLKANSGAANNSPYTITPSDDTDYYSISLTGVSESSKIKFETVSGSTRAIIFGVQLY